MMKNKYLIFYGYYNYTFIDSIDFGNVSEVLNECEADGYFMFRKYPMLFVSKEKKCIGIPLYYGNNMSINEMKSNISSEDLKDLNREFYCLLSEDNILYDEDAEACINVIKI